MTENDTELQPKPRGSIHIFKNRDGKFLACHKTTMTDPIGRRDDEYEVLGSGDTISGALDSAADRISDDAEGLRWSDDPTSD